MLFRELNNEHSKWTYNLEFAEDCTIELEDILTGEKKEVLLKDGNIEIEITQPAGYKFLKYTKL
jgi:hypothetical protein